MSIESVVDREQTGRRKSLDELQTRGCYSQARHASRRGNGKTFREHLPEDARARRTQRRAHRDLAAARGCASQQQVRDVGARDEQNETDGAEQHPQDKPHVPDHLFVQRHERDAPAAIELRMVGRELGGDAVELRLCAARRHARLQQAGHLQEPRIARHTCRARCVSDIEVPRLPDADVFVRDGELAGHHAEQRARDAVQNDPAPDHAAVGAETARPESVADHDDRQLLRGFLRVEGPPEQRSDAEHSEEVFGDRSRDDLLGLAALLQSSRLRCVPAGHRLERRARRAPVRHVRGCRAFAIARLLEIGFEDRDDPVGRRVRQRAKQHGIDDAERGGISPYTQAENRDDERGEARLLAEDAQAIAKVFEKHRTSARPRRLDSRGRRRRRAS